MMKQNAADDKLLVKIKQRLQNHTKYNSVPIIACKVYLHIIK